VRKTKDAQLHNLHLSLFIRQASEPDIAWTGLPATSVSDPDPGFGSGFNLVSLLPVCYLDFVQVSGEYAMLHHGAAAGAFDLRNTLTEVLTSMRRYRYPSGIRIQSDSGIFWTGRL
jgi:hypothetical protein